MCIDNYFVEESVRYSLKDVSAFCAVNNIKERGLISLGLSVCQVYTTTISYTWIDRARHMGYPAVAGSISA